MGGTTSQTKCWRGSDSERDDGYGEGEEEVEREVLALEHQRLCGPPSLAALLGMTSHNAPEYTDLHTGLPAASEPEYSTHCLLTSLQLV